MKMDECLNKMVRPMKKAWAKISKRLRLRKKGHVKLWRDVRSCEYDDVHVLWDMLKRNETDVTRSKKKACCNFVQWAKHSPFICRAA